VGQFEVRPTPPTVLRLAQIAAPALVLVGDADIADVIDQFLAAPFTSFFASGAFARLPRSKKYTELGIP
jgi:hypothetical protein